MAVFPFTAIVGSDDMALSLLLTTISPEVGGVLVRGEKGTAKSTMVRALAEIIPPLEVVKGCRFSCDPKLPDPNCPDGPHLAEMASELRPAKLVELPVGATDDRVTGSLDLKAALAEGQAQYQPGLLAAANRGILYVDEVNLLHDHLVDLLLDAAAMGKATVERDGVSINHAARIILIGTMNPEEGELRPQLLDRFGLTVEIKAPKDPDLRVQVIKRRLSFENNPEEFVSRYASTQQELAKKIVAARELLPHIQLSDKALTMIATVCAAFEVDGLRADIVTARAAIAHAALSGSTTVTKADIRAAARLALPHRRRRNPFDAPGLDEELLDQILDQFDEDPPEPDDPNPKDSPEDAETSTEQDSNSTQDNSNPESLTKDSTTADNEFDPKAQDAPQPSKDNQPAPSPASDSAQSHNQSETGSARDLNIGLALAEKPYRPRILKVRGLGDGEPGKRSRAETSIGRAVGVNPKGGTKIHLPATIRTAARQATQGKLEIAATDIRHARLEGRESNLIIFCVDASGSMAAKKRMSTVKTAIMSLMLDAYQRRDKVALVTFREQEASLALPPTNSVEVAAARLQELPHGGRTPLAEGLNLAAQIMEIERIKDPHRRPLLVLITDGRANAYSGALAAAQKMAARLGDSPAFRTGRADAIVIDAETGKMRLRLAREIAALITADYLELEEISTDNLTNQIRSRIGKVA